MKCLNARALYGAALGLLLALPLASNATTGYFALGYGAKSMGMAGAVVAAPQDAVAAAANPAGMALVGHRFDLGLRIFSPIREAELDPTVVGGSFKVGDKSTRELFVIPNIGYTQQVTDRIWAGLSIYGNGGLNTTYGTNIYDETTAVLGAFQQGFQQALAMGATPAQAQAAGAQAASMVPPGTRTGALDTGQLGVDLYQIIFAPTLSFKFNENHSFGLAPLIGVQEFTATGLGNFQCFTPTANSTAESRQSCATTGQPTVFSQSLTDNGSSVSTGVGVRAGWIGKLHPKLTMGVTGASKIYMGEFDKYSELFAENGDFDIPANFAVGVAVQATSALKVAVDYQRIFYNDVNAVGNPGPIASPQGPTIPPGSGLLGQDNGIGFGWEDINIVRVGGLYELNPRWTLRGGFAYNESPIPDSQILFNILALATPEWHLTAGFTYSPRPYAELSFAYMHAFNHKQSTNQTALGVPGSIEMHQNSLELSGSLKF